MRFRGREMAHTEIGRKLLDRLVIDLADCGADRAACCDGRAPDRDGDLSEEEVTGG